LPSGELRVADRLELREIVERDGALRGLAGGRGRRERDEEGRTNRNGGNEVSDVSLHGWIPVGDMAGRPARIRA